MKFLRVLKIMAKILYHTCLIGSITFMFITQFYFNISTDLMLGYQQRQIESLQEDNNSLLDNDMTLSTDIQETARQFNKILKELNNRITTVKDKLIEPDINKLLNTSVFVRDPMGEGSGTVIKNINNEMYVLTCYHVVSTIVAMNEVGFPVRGTLGHFKSSDTSKIEGMVSYLYDIVKYDEEKDLALLKVNYSDPNLIAANLSPTDPEIGDTTYSVGNPIGLIRTVSKGILSNKIENSYVTDNTTTFGNSGGGLFNKYGQLIGVPNQVSVYTNKPVSIPESSLGLSINLKQIKDFLKGTECGEEE